MLKRFTHILGLLVVLAACSFALMGSASSEDWSSYQPAHTLGSGENDWWSTYPTQHADAGKAVEHPSFVLDALKEKPVLILVHSSTCKSCVAQIANLNGAMKSYGSDLSYNDVLGEGSSLEKAVGILDVYNPTGGMPYVPTTVFITLIKGSDGKVQVAWHSQIDAMDAGQIEGYIKDSIYYYKQNAANWK